jgi:DNA-binding transcriptional MerR regulator
MALTVSQLARLAGISVRTLHHYDELGLLRPSGRAANGYRVYEKAQLQRLQQILFYRELDLPLDEIHRIMSDPAFDVRAALIEQRRQFELRSERAQQLIEAIDKALEGIIVFDPFEKEAEERWGSTEAFKESKRRTAKYTKSDWAQLKAEGQAIQDGLARLLDQSVRPDDPRALELAEQHRRHISKWFYECTYAIHRGLAELYVADGRFTGNIDQTRKGLAAFQRAAILANAVAREARGD